MPSAISGLLRKYNNIPSRLRADGNSTRIEGSRVVSTAKVELQPRRQGRLGDNFFPLEVWIYKETCVPAQWRRRSMSRCKTQV